MPSISGYNGQVLYGDGESLIVGWGSESYHFVEPRLIGFSASSESPSYVTGRDGFEYHMPPRAWEIELRLQVPKVERHAAMEPIERKVLDRLTVTELFAEIHRKLNARG